MDDFEIAKGMLKPDTKKKEAFRYHQKFITQSYHVQVFQNSAEISYPSADWEISLNNC